MDPQVYPDGIVAWKESGGAAAYSPNAALVVAMKRATTYTVALKWRANRAGSGAIYAGAGPINDAYSPTRVIADVIPSTSSQVMTSMVNRQYQLSGSDGAAWSDLDSSRLSLTLAPSQDSIAVVTANADLWTANSGYNQDLGIAISGADPKQYPAGIVGWKESGGAAGFSPNAAAIQAVYPLAGGSSYSVSLRWKTNRPAPGATIYVGAGSAPAFSPTRLTVRLLPAGMSHARTTQQYSMAGGDGHSWADLDPTSLSLRVTGKGCPAIVSANADLWTDGAHVNQDLAISVDGSIVAWKESGGAATFSPNAAFVQAMIPTSSGVTYNVSLRWKSNVASPTSIHAGAGPIAGMYSPTLLSVQQTC
jgi:hypothetical protein